MAHPALVAALATTILNGGGWRKLPPSFQMIALSHIADGCRDRRAADDAGARQCLTDVVTRAARLAPRPLALVERGDGLLASHFNLILDDLDEAGVAHDEPAHAALVAAVAARSVAEPTAQLSSYADTDVRWPADQTATLASLARYDRLHGTHHLTRPLAAFRAFVATRAFSSRWSLPWSESTGRAPHAETPRGCANAFSVRYLADADPDLARAWWAVFVRQFFVDRILVAGFREWPPGVDHPADADSGPIEAGIGAAATAFGLLAARAMADYAVLPRLVETTQTVRAAAALSPKLRAARDTPLAAAILFAAGL